MIKKYFLLICFLSFPFLANAQNFDNVKVLSVYDGDTFKVNLPCSEDIFCKDISVRVNGIDTPEIKGKDSCEKQKAKEAQVLTKSILKKGPVILKNCKRDKYFRLLCDVSVLGPNQGYNLSEELLEANLAVEYYGETKADVDWCKLPKSTKKRDNFIDELFASLQSILEEIIQLIKKSF
jgi:Micrococcal nuclease (thermonuclease) homologs